MSPKLCFEVLSQCSGVANMDPGIQHALRWLGTPMLIALAVGAAVGLATGRSRVAQWLTVGVTAAGGIGAVLAAWVMIPGIPSTGGTNPHHFLPELTDEVLGYTSLGLMFFTPLVLGFVVGSASSCSGSSRSDSVRALSGTRACGPNETRRRIYLITTV